jgi:hypothetical protein
MLRVHCPYRIGELISSFLAERQLKDYLVDMGQLRLTHL